MKKLLIVVGAGASVEFGMPSVSKIDEWMQEWALTNYKLKDDDTKSLYTWVKELLNSYIDNNPKAYKENIINFENLLFVIQNIAYFSRDSSWGTYTNSLSPFIHTIDFPPIIRFGKEKIADYDDFSNLHSQLVDNLVLRMRDLCKTLQVVKSNELSELSNLFTSLKAEFELGFINLNYDNVVLSALPGLKTGFDLNTGEFDRSKIYNDDWNFCYHLHGSVHFDMNNTGISSVDLHKIRWNNDLISTFGDNSFGRSGNQTSGGLDHLSSTIITGLDKANQVLHEPFNSYYMQLDRLTYEADAILFLGYGFNDIHLNSVFPFIREDKKIRKVVIVDYARESQEALSYRHDRWSTSVFRTIPFNGFDMGDGVSLVPLSLPGLKRRNDLEKSRNPKLPLAVWYNGMLEACKYSDKIKQELL
jgi:hypothetical protein